MLPLFCWRDWNLCALTRQWKSTFSVSQLGGVLGYAPRKMKAENLIFKSKSSKTAPAGNVFKTNTWCDETYVQSAFSAPPAVWPRITNHAIGGIW